MTRDMLAASDQLVTMSAISQTYVAHESYSNTSRSSAEMNV